MTRRHATLTLLVVLVAGGLVLRTRPGTGRSHLDAGGWPVALVLDPRTDRLFIANRATRTVPGSVVVVDTRTFRVVRRVPIEGEAVAVDARTHRVFVADVNAGGVRLLDARSGALLRTVRLGLATIPVPLSVDTRTNRVFVANDSPTCCVPGTVSMLDAHSGRRLRTVTVAGAPAALAVVAASGRVFVANATPNASGFLAPGQVSVLDATTGRILHTVTVGLNPDAIVVSARTGRVFVLNQASNTVSVLDGRTGHLVRVTTVGPSPMEAAIDERAGRVFVLNAGLLDPMTNAYRGPGSVSVLDAASGRLLRTLRLAQAPQDATVDERTGRVFIVVGDELAPTVSERIVVLEGRSGAPVRSLRLPLPSEIMADARRGRLFVVSEATTVPGVDPWWGWLPDWLRRRLPFRSKAQPARSVPASLTTLDMAR